MARAPLPRPAPAAGSPENFSLATFQVTHMYVCRSASSSRSWCSQRKLRGKSFQQSHRRARAGRRWEGSRTGVQVAGSLYLQSDTPALKILESEIAVGKAICPHPSVEGAAAARPTEFPTVCGEFTGESGGSFSSAQRPIPHWIPHQCPPPDVVPAARAGGSPHNFSSGRHRHSRMADQFVHRRPGGVTPVVLTGGKFFVGAFATSASAGTAAPWPKRPPCCGGSPQNFSTIRHGELRVAGQ